MRLAEADLAKLAEGRCPDCEARDFADGPRGGLCRNIACRRCGAEFNVTRFANRLVMADRLTPFGEPDLDRLRSVYGIRL